MFTISNENQLDYLIYKIIVILFVSYIASRGNYNNQFPYLTGTPCSACPSGTTCANSLCDDGSGNTNVVGKYYRLWLFVNASARTGRTGRIFVLYHPCHYCHFSFDLFLMSRDAHWLLFEYIGFVLSGYILQNRKYYTSEQIKINNCIRMIRNDQKKFM